MSLLWQRPASSAPSLKRRCSYLSSESRLPASWWPGHRVLRMFDSCPSWTNYTSPPPPQMCWSSETYKVTSIKLSHLSSFNTHKSKREVGEQCSGCKFTNTEMLEEFAKTLTFLSVTHDESALTVLRTLVKLTADFRSTNIPLGAFFSYKLTDGDHQSSRTLKSNLVPNRVNEEYQPCQPSYVY